MVCVEVCRIRSEEQFNSQSERGDAGGADWNRAKSWPGGAHGLNFPTRLSNGDHGNPLQNYPLFDILSQTLR